MLPLLAVLLLYEEEIIEYSKFKKKLFFVMLNCCDNYLKTENLKNVKMW